MSIFMHKLHVCKNLIFFGIRKQLVRGRCTSPSRFSSRDSFTERRKTPFVDSTNRTTKKKKTINKSKRCRHTFEIDIAIHRVFLILFIFDHKFHCKCYRCYTFSLSSCSIFPETPPRRNVNNCAIFHVCYVFLSSTPHTSTSPRTRIASRKYNYFIQFPAHNKTKKKKN